MTKVQINEPKKAKRIPEGLYGFNMEITRTTFWNGLAAEMFNNRKFATGEDAPNAWTLCGGQYVKEYDKSSCDSNVVLLNKGDVLCYAENTVNLKKDETYSFRICVNGKAKRTFELSIDDIKVTLNVPKEDNDFTVAKVEFKAEKDVCEGKTQIKLVSGDTTYISAISLMNKNNYYGMRYDVIEKLRELRPSFLRFPGGCCADHFEWKEGLKPVDFRKPMDGSSKASFLFRNSHTQDVNDIGVDEFILLCRAVGTEPEYTMRLVLNNAEEARELVEYCNGSKETEWGAVRESRGFGPFNIRLWYIGNEIYFFGYGLEHDAIEAARKTDEYNNAMKSADPTIKTIVGVCPGDDKHSNWSRDYIKNMHSNYDIISYHRYNGTEIDDAPSDLLHTDAVRKMVIDEIDGGLERIKNDFCAARWNELTVDIDEWNYSWGLKGSTLMFLSNALMFHFMAKTSDKYHLEDARFFHPVNEGMIVTGPMDAVLDTSGILFKYLLKHRNGVILETAREDLDLDVLATAHGERRVVSVINRVEEKKNFTISDETTAREAKISGVRIDKVSGLNNDISEFEYTVKPGDEIEIPGNSLLFIEY